MAPPEKKLKTEGGKAVEAVDVDKAEEKKAEPPKELEADAKKCLKPKVQDAPAFLTSDTTLNVLQSPDSTILMSMSEGGIQHFLAGARANIGVSKGRYMFEVGVVQLVSTSESVYDKTGGNVSVRVGFSTAGSDLILGESGDSIGFDSKGNILHDKQKSFHNINAKFTRDNVVAVLLNLDKDSTNFNTISLFRDGARISQPVPLPENLRGKVLYPHVAYKGAHLHVNFGPNPSKPLPFKCRMLRDAALVDVAVSKPAQREDGKYSVVFPVSLPDEGSFDWLDIFLEKNKQYLELSDRAILEWADKSGIWKKNAARSSNDRPDVQFQARELEDGSVRRSLYMAAAMQRRDYVVMEVKGNLLKEERAGSLAKFSAPHFKKTAFVMIGEPVLEFKRRSHQLALADKQAASDKAFQQKKLEEQRKKDLEKKQKAMAKTKRKLERQKKKELAAAVEKVKKAAAEKAKATAIAGEAGKKEDTKTDDKEEKKEEPAKADEDSSEDEAEEEEKEDDEKPPKVELTAEEKATPFRKHAAKDLSDSAFSSSFAKFSIPDGDEGFDEMKYEWTRLPKKCKDLLEEYKMKRKLVTRVEDITPSAWFHQQWKQWQATLKIWNFTLNEYKMKLTKKAAAKVQREMKRANALKIKELKEKKAKELAEKVAKEGKTAGEEKKEEENKEEEKQDEPEEEEEEEEAPTVDFDGLDVFGVEFVQDTGGGVPLCKEFQHEDWTMLTLRFELHLLAHSFQRDVNDEDRPGMYIDHLGFYYQKYFKKALTAKEFGVETFKELVELVNDTLCIGEKDVVLSQLDAEMENLQVFMKLAEEARRHRLLQIDLGNKKAELHLQASGLSAWKWTAGGGQQQQQEQAQSKGSAKGGGGYQPYGKGSGKDAAGGRGWQGKGGYGKWKGLSLW